MRRASACGADHDPVVIAAIADARRRRGAGGAGRLFRRCRAARIRTTWRRRRTAPSGTPRSRRARSAFSIRRPARPSRFRSAPDSAPHGVIVGPDRAAWITDGGQNAIARVDPATKAVKLFPLPKEFRRRQSQHRDLRPQRHSLVHRAERRLWPRRSGDRQGRGLEGAEGRRPLRHHHDAERRGLVRLARRRSHRQDRHRERRRADGAAAQAGRRPAPHLVGLQGPAVGELLEHRRGRPLRSGRQGVEGLGAAEEQGAAATRSMSTTRTRSGSPTWPPTPSCASIR